MLTAPCSHKPSSGGRRLALHNASAQGVSPVLAMLAERLLTAGTYDRLGGPGTLHIAR